MVVGFEIKISLPWHVLVETKVPAGQELRHWDWYKRYGLVHPVHTELLLQALPLVGQSLDDNQIHNHNQLTLAYVGGDKSTSWTRTQTLRLIQKIWACTPSTERSTSASVAICWTVFEK